MSNTTVATGGGLVANYPTPSQAAPVVVVGSGGTGGFTSTLGVSNANGAGGTSIFKPYAGSQYEMFGAPVASYRIFKAKNGHIVQVSRGDGYLADVWVVPEDQDPFDVARAAVVAANLEGK